MSTLWVDFVLVCVQFVIYKSWNCAGLKKVLSNKSYEGELSFLPSPNKESHTRDGTVCKVGSVLLWFTGLWL